MDHPASIAAHRTGAAAKVILTLVGTATFTFTDGNTASFAYNVSGVNQTIAITRKAFRTPGAVFQ